MTFLCVNSTCSAVGTVISRDVTDYAPPCAVCGCLGGTPEPTPEAPAPPPGDAGEQ